MPKSHAYISIAVAAIAAFVIGLIAPRAVTGNDDNPVGYRTRPQYAKPASTPTPTPSFIPTRMSGGPGTAQCFHAQTCTVSIDILTSPTPSACEDGDATPCPPPTPCPNQASCIRFSGSYVVQHIRPFKIMGIPIGDQPHTAENKVLQGIIIVAPPDSPAPAPHQ
jgi:hypothetical protein